jgi:N-acetylglucosaminyl-diphospho-decaprenol L-rhamnosyltransferase
VSRVDVVIVSYNSRDQLRAGVEPLAGAAEIDVVVVDNNSPDKSLEAVADLDVRTIQTGANRGFGAASNVGWRSGTAPYVLFLNPDAAITPGAIQALAGVLDEDSKIGIVGPKIVDERGKLDFSQRLFPRFRQDLAQAFFLHFLFPSASWTDGAVRDNHAYESSHDAQWLSGACLLCRRSVLEELGGFDERFFLYCEDMDLCFRAWEHGYRVRFVGEVRVVHIGGASAPRAATLPILATSRVRFGEKHRAPVSRVVERACLGASAATHLVVSRGGVDTRAAHLRSLRIFALPGAGKPGGN